MGKVKVDSTGEKLREGLYFDPLRRTLLCCLGPELENEFRERKGYSRLSASETQRLIPLDYGDL